MDQPKGGMMGLEQLSKAQKRKAQPKIGIGAKKKLRLLDEEEAEEFSAGAVQPYPPS